jgi:hypothetical protein
MIYYTHFKTPFLNIKNYDFNIDVVRIIPEEMAREHKVIAIDKIGHILTVGMVHPEDKNLVEFLEQETKMMIIPFQITLSDLQEVIASAYIKEKELNWVG